ncbi:MAG: C40 family peptidase [Bacteroides sp.]|nr:C40 family peptidase [Bacteroides sp.]
MKKCKDLSVFLLSMSFLLLAVGCKSSHKNTDTVREETMVTVTQKQKGSSSKIVNEAKKWLGTPYKYADWERGKGTDCSGMVCKVYEAAIGVKLPRNSKQQSEYCRKLKKKDVHAGDLVFFATGKDKHAVSHVGIMIDDEQFIHASTKKGVIISEVSTPYYERTFIMYGRVPDWDPSK